ncbi:MAG: inorganic phosphate transporter [Promethearchaeota archaeon]|nr:MAG: inorganic phosphate transporter [Candidatus Lokiarchaeota archaeon]
MALPIILGTFLVIAIIIAFGIGANDETFAGIYGSRILNMKQILILAAIFSITGALILGEAVSKTVGKGILVGLNNPIVITILISTAIWLILSSALGLPISTTHATIGAVIGLGIALNASLDWGKIIYLSMWWVLSPIIGYVVTFGVFKLMHYFKAKHLNGFQSYEKTEKIFSYIVLIVICVTAFSRAGNDCSNAVGIVVGVGDLQINILLLITGLSLAGGLIVLGRGVIKSVGRITELYPSTTFAAQIPTAAILFVGTTLGIPLSGSHMLVASLVGLSKANRTPTKRGLWKIVLVWFLTFPMAGVLAILLYFPINAIIPI